MSKDLTEALRALTENAPAPEPYEPKARGLAPKVKSAAALTLSGSSDGGIASPLTETAHADRTYHAQTILTTTDGFLSIVLRPINKVKFTDANGATVEMIYKAP